MQTENPPYHPWWFRSRPLHRAGASSAGHLIISRCSSMSFRLPVI